MKEKEVREFVVNLIFEINIIKTSSAEDNTKKLLDNLLEKLNKINENMEDTEFTSLIKKIIYKEMKSLYYSNS